MILVGGQNSDVMRTFVRTLFPFCASLQMLHW